MLTLLFIICFFAVFGKLLMFGIKAAWGISKFLLTIVLLPVILIGLVVGGLIYLAFPILIVVGIVGLLLECSNHKIMQGKAEREKENGRSERQAEDGSAGFIETASWYVPCLF